MLWEREKMNWLQYCIHVPKTACLKQSIRKKRRREGAGALSAVQFSSRWYLCARKSPYALHPVSRKFPQSCLWNGFNVRLTDDGPLSSFQGRSSSASSFNVSLLQAIDGVMSLALCRQVVSQAPPHFRSSEKQATCFARQSIGSVISLHSGISRAVYPQEFSKVPVGRAPRTGIEVAWFQMPVWCKAWHIESSGVGGWGEGKR